MLVSQKVNDSDNLADAEYLTLQWHTCRDFLAVSAYIPSAGGFISFFTKKGGKPFHTSKPKPNQRAARLAWHPTEPVLAIGWDTGKVTLLDPTRKSDRDLAAPELDQVCCMTWDDGGTMMIVSDVNGHSLLYHADARDFDKCKVINSGRTREEMATDICAKKINRINMEPRAKPAERPMTAVRSRPPENDEFVGLLTRTAKFEAYGDSDVKGVGAASQEDFVTVFLIATNKGSVYMYEADGLLTKIFQADSSIRQILDMPDRNFLLAITDGLLFYQLALEGRSANDKIKVKLSGRRQHFSMIRLDSDNIALCYGEREIRIWDLHNEDSAIFRLNPDKGYAGSEQVLCLSYSSKKDSVSGGTSDGKVATWRRNRELKDAPVDQKWRLQNAMSIGTDIMQMAWSNTSTALAVNSGNSVQIFQSQGIDFQMDTDYGIIQTGPQSLSLVKLTEPVESQEVQLDAPIKGFHINGEYLLFWDDAHISLFKINNAKDSPLGIVQEASIAASVAGAIYYNQLVYTMEKDSLVVRTLKGTEKNSVNFPKTEGEPELLDLNGKWLCLATTRGYIKIYNLDDNNLHVTHSFNVTENIKDFSRFVSVKLNVSGSRVSFRSQQRSEELHDKLFVWDAETGSVGYFSFSLGITDQQQSEAESENSRQGSRPKTAAARKIEKEQSRYSMPYHLPGNHFWDRTDPRFLVCEANHISADSSASQLLSMFVTAEHGIQMQDLQPRPAKADSLIALSVPHLYFLKNIESDEEDDLLVERSISRLILRRTLREFVGIEASDRKAVEAMLNFSFYLSVGQMDNAFKAIKFIKNDTVWEHMAQMCVKTRRIDVARVCLGHMRNARAARALRLSIQNGDSVDVQAARLAVELGMIEEAIAIYASVSRYDMVNKIYQAQNKWNEAFEVAEKHDRIHLRNTHYNYAKYLESVGAIEAGIDNYEKSQTHQFEVPRMLCEEPKALDLYVKRRRDPLLYKWWAQFLESTTDLEAARNYYKYADDYLSVVRILCYENRINEAAQLVDRTDDRAAAFHLARYYETQEDYENAVRYFAKAGAYSSAIRLANEHNMADRLANLALMAGGAEMVEAAKYYEEMPGHADKAVMLYHKAGLIGRALDLAFRTEQFTALDLIAQDLNENSDPRVLERAAQFFSNNQQDRTAYAEAVELCREKNVIINEELAELLTPPKPDKAMASERTRLLEDIGRCCLQQGNYHFAAKKFTQAGNKLEAMRALLKSGDTPRIILFANTARNKDIYRMAGNYLQTLNWKEDVNLMRQIENCYVKADALGSLAAFYEACAEVEIDDFRDYEKGLAALNESLRRWTKNAEKEDGLEAESSEKIERLRDKIGKIKRYLAARQTYESDPGEALRVLGEMAEEERMNDSVRLGDIFAILVLHNVKRNNFRKAWQIIEQCGSRRPPVHMRNYLSGAMLDQICDEAGVPRLKREASDVDVDEDTNTVEYSHAMKRRIQRRSSQPAMDDGSGDEIE